MIDEVAREGNRELARFLGMSLRSTSRLVREMKEIGVVFEVLKRLPPRPGKKIGPMQRVNCWFPSRVMAFMGAWQRNKNINP